MSQCDARSWTLLALIDGERLMTLCQPNTTFKYVAPHVHKTLVEVRELYGADGNAIAASTAQRDALASIVRVLGPNAPDHKGICAGCQTEIAEALSIAKAALAAQPPTPLRAEKE